MWSFLCLCFLGTRQEREVLTLKLVEITIWFLLYRNNSHSNNILIGIVLPCLEGISVNSAFFGGSETSDLPITIVNDKLYFEPYTNDQNIYLKNNTVHFIFRRSEWRLNFSSTLRDGFDIHSQLPVTKAVNIRATPQYKFPLYKIKLYRLIFEIDMLVLSCMVQNIISNIPPI